MPIFERLACILLRTKWIMTMFNRFTALTGAVMLVFGWLSSVQAATNYAASVSFVDVSNACYAAAPGDIVIMPPGMAVWSNALWLPLGVSLSGSGTNQTIITDAAILSNNALINAVNVPGGFTSLSANYPTRISNFQIVGAGNATYGLESDAVITIGSGVDNQPLPWRIDHVFFNQCVSHQIIVWNKLGLIDDCYFLMNSPSQTIQAVRVIGDLQSLGSYSWSIPYLYGTTNSLYVEGNTFDNETANSVNGWICDIPQGGGMVFRDNLAINAVWGNHGLEGNRSCRWWEIYNNTFMATNNSFTEELYAMDFRGGTGVVFSNTIAGYRIAESTENYRSTTYFAMMGGANGLNNVDANGPAILVSGTWTNASVICTSNQLTFGPGTWTTNLQGFTLVDTNVYAYDLYGQPALAFALIISNDDSTLTFYPEKTTGSTTPCFAINNGDTWVLTHVNRALDQIGSGSDTGQVLPFSNNQLVGSDNQPVETLYWWGNTLNGADCHFKNNNYLSIIEGRDFTNDVPKPGYTPLPFPHPLNTTIIFSSGLPYYSLAVTGGAGGGVYAPGTAVAITAATPIGETFIGWGGDTNYLASAAAATTSLIMPSNSVAVQAQYSWTADTNMLVAQWTLAGDVNDHAGTNHGTAYGAPTYVTGPTGAANSALALNGSSQYVQTTTLADWGAACASGFTLTAWVKTSEHFDQEAIFGSQGASGMAVSLYLNYAGGSGSGMIEGIVRDGNNTLHACDVQTNTGITDGNWHFIAWVDNPSANTGIIYVDGVALNTVTQQSAATATTALAYPMGLGMRVGLNDALFNGALADCRVYNQTLSATAISTLFSNGAVVLAAVVPTPSAPIPPSNLQVHPATP